MTNYRVGAIDRDFVTRYLQSNEHQLQNSLDWFDFLKDYSGETDRSVTLFADEQPVGFILALQHRNLIQSLPYPASYSGIFYLPGTKLEVRNALTVKSFDYYKELCDVFSICTSPLLAHSEAGEEHFDYSVSSRILYIDLGRELLSGTTSKFRNNLKRNLRKAKDAGVTIDESASESMLKSWYSCYEKRMEELGGMILTYNYFAAMRQHLMPKGNFHLFSAVRGDQYLGGIVVVNNNYCADYYLSIFDRESDETQASTTLFHHALGWAKQQGISYFNLQASPTSQTALYEFKKSWGATGGSHQYLVKILGNRDMLLGASAEQVRREYRFHYLVPFEALAGKSEVRTIEQTSLQTSR
jgi:hypothetical protein